MTRQEALEIVKQAARARGQIVADGECASKTDKAEEADIWKALTALENVWLEESNDAL